MMSGRIIWRDASTLSIWTGVLSSVAAHLPRYLTSIATKTGYS